MDQNIYAATARLLGHMGHDVVLVGQIGLSQAGDEDLLHKAREQGRLFVTRDRDFGNLVFVKGLRAGVLYLRILRPTLNAVHSQLELVLREHTEEELAQSFVVIQPWGHRIRMLHIK